LRAAMEPVVIEPEHVVAARRGAVRLTFSLPRFGMSLLTLAPAGEALPEEPPPKDPGCSCRSSSRTTPLAFPLLSLVVLALARRLDRRSRQR
ncbi:MAG TPA: hypothetical protein VFZ53_06040, partial [Polyangiaceae bacterium]